MRTISWGWYDISWFPPGCTTISYDILPARNSPDPTSHTCERGEDPSRVPFNQDPNPAPNPPISFLTIQSPPQASMCHCAGETLLKSLSNLTFCHWTTGASWFSLSLGYLNKKDHFLMVINVTKASIPKNRSLKQSGHHHITRSLHNGPIFCQRMWNE